MGTDQLWQEIVAAALVGTERPALPSPPVGTPLGDLLARLDAVEAEKALLSAAAATALYRRAGWLPPEDARPAPEPCAREALPRCPPRAAHRLRAIVGGECSELLPEWLRAAAWAGVRVPEAALPELLEMARSRPELWDLLAPVAGKRGRWLAALNPDWSPLVAAEGDEETVWETGARSERLALLERLRASDPDRARERVAATWTSDPPEDRFRFLATFATGLSMADEPFLEAALDDRRKEVRQAAADLLARLPESRLCHRMEERLLPLLTVRRGMRGEAIEVQLPASRDKAMARDGIESRQWDARLGEKAGWILQMLAAVPPSTWATRWGRKPAALIATVRGDWQMTLLGGWSQATVRHRDAEWAEALLRAWLSLDGGHEFRVLWWGLFAVLPVERRDRLILELLRAERSRIFPELASLLRECGHDWSPELTRAVTDRLRRHVAGNVWEAGAEIQELLKDAIHHIPPALGPEVAAGWVAVAEAWGAWAEEIEAFLGRLQFRHEMLREFS